MEIKLRVFGKMQPSNCVGGRSSELWGLPSQRVFSLTIAGVDDGYYHD